MANRRSTRSSGPPPFYDPSIDPDRLLRTNSSNRVGRRGQRTRTNAAVGARLLALDPSLAGVLIDNNDNVVTAAAPLPPPPVGSVPLNIVDAGCATDIKMSETDIKMSDSDSSLTTLSRTPTPPIHYNFVDASHESAVVSPDSDSSFDIPGITPWAKSQDFCNIMNAPRNSDSSLSTFNQSSTPPAASTPARQGQNRRRRPEILARAEGFTDCTLNGRPVRLRLSLQVAHDGNRWDTRLVYYADIYLVQDGYPEQKVGYIHAHRVSKRTRVQPDVSDQWIRDWLDAPLEGDDAIDMWGQSLAWALQAIYGWNGQPRAEVHEQFLEQLGDNGNDLLYISTLQIYSNDEETGENVSQLGHNYVHPCVIMRQAKFYISLLAMVLHRERWQHSIVYCGLCRRGVLLPVL